MLPPHVQEALQELEIEVPACRRVLLVDDEEQNLEVLAALLEESWSVFTAESGEKALDTIAEQGQMDLVIADQRMPGMKGVELLARVAETSPATVRIVLTAYSDIEPMLDAINLGSVYRFLLKPFDPVEIRSIVKDALRMKTISAALHELVAALQERRGELARTLEKLKETQDQLLVAERKATLGSVTSGIVHELRNLSTSLSFLIDSVRQTTDHPVLLESAERTRANLDSLLELLEQIRTFARSDSVEVRRELTPAASFFASTVELFNMEGLAARCPVRITVDPGVVQLQIDQSRLRQAVIALLRNAALASTEGMPVVLSVTAEEGDTARVEVRDLGRGMDPETLRRAPEPFFSAFSPPGLGLGLEIATLTANAHGGSLKLDSAPGEGTRAWLLLPGAVVTD
jgi:signal transduction histidine kinase